MYSPRTAIAESHEVIMRDLRDSAADFCNIVFPKLKTLGFIEGELIPVESILPNDANQFDMEAGIDYCVRSQSGLRGISSRIQWGDVYDIDIRRRFGLRIVYRTFTIRKERATGARTEFEKRLEAISRGFYYPHLTCQAYLTHRHGDILAVAIVKTDDLVSFIKRHPCTVKANKVAAGGNTFYIVDWGRLEFYGYEVKQWLCPEQQHELRKLEKT